MLRHSQGGGRLSKHSARILAMGATAVALSLSGLALTLVAGQAVGPVLAGNEPQPSGPRQVGTGSVTGTGGVTVTQGLVIDPDVAPTIAGSDDFTVIVHDEGTSFTAAIETNVGQPVVLCVYLQNNSEKTINATLELTLSAGLDVDVEEFSSTGTTAVPCSTTAMTNNGIVQEAQLARNRWLMKVGGGSTASVGAGVDNNDGFSIRIEPQDDMRPGFYTMSAKIAQITG